MKETHLETTFCDTNKDFIEYLGEAFSGYKNVDVESADIFSDHPDAVVSPGNSFGHMDYGLDKIMEEKFGIEKRLQGIIKEKYYGELPVGQALIMETADADIPYFISSPTMRSPIKLEPRTLNIYLGTRAIFTAILGYNKGISEEKRICNVRIPGMGTGSGRVPLDVAAIQMKQAYDAVILGKGIENFPGDWKEAKTQEASIRQGSIE